MQLFPSSPPAAGADICTAALAGCAAIVADLDTMPGAQTAPLDWTGMASLEQKPALPAISEFTCDYWQVLGFIVCIGMYGGMYCGTYWYVLAWYVLWHVLVCIIFGMYYMYW